MVDEGVEGRRWEVVGLEDAADVGADREGVLADLGFRFRAGLDVGRAGIKVSIYTGIKGCRVRATRVTYISLLAPR